MGARFSLNRSRSNSLIATVLVAGVIVAASSPGLSDDRIAASTFQTPPPPAAPPPAATAPPQAGSSPIGAGKSITVSVLDDCHANLFSDNCDYDKPVNRTWFANALAQSLTAKGFVVVRADQSPSLTLAVTVTGIGDNAGPGCSVELCAKATASANYQITPAAGNAGPVGTANSTADDTRPGLQQLADKIAAAVAGASPLPTASPASK